MAATLDRLDADIQRLTLAEQLWLMERLARHIRKQITHDQTESQIAEMAADPEIQRELRQIRSESGETE
jgi:hypothetical protein